MVNDYIRREDMLNAVEQLNIISSVDGIGNPTNAEDFRVQFLGTVLKVEPADVAPVVHARWKKSDSYIDRYDETIEILICKSCGFKHHYCQGDTSMSDDGWFHFCPNCGAKMDGGEKHE